MNSRFLWGIFFVSILNMSSTLFAEESANNPLSKLIDRIAFQYELQISADDNVQAGKALCAICREKIPTQALYVLKWLMANGTPTYFDVPDLVSVPSKELQDIFASLKSYSIDNNRGLDFSSLIVELLTELYNSQSDICTLVEQQCNQDAATHE